MYRLHTKTDQRDTRRQKSSLVSFHEVQTRCSKVRSTQQLIAPSCPRDSWTSSVPAQKPTTSRPPPISQQPSPLPSKHIISHPSTSILPKPPPRGVPKVKPLGKLAPLQMQSPSMMMALRRVSMGSKEKMDQARVSLTLQDKRGKKRLQSTKPPSTYVTPRNKIKNK